MWQRPLKQRRCEQSTGSDCTVKHGSRSCIEQLDSVKAHIRSSIDQHDARVETASTRGSRGSRGSRGNQQTSPAYRLTWWKKVSSEKVTVRQAGATQLSCCELSMSPQRRAADGEGRLSEPGSSCMQSAYRRSAAPRTAVGPNNRSHRHDRETHSAITAPLPPPPRLLTSDHTTPSTSAGRLASLSAAFKPISRLCRCAAPVDYLTDLPLPCAVALSA